MFSGLIHFYLPLFDSKVNVNEASAEEEGFLTTVTDSSLDHTGRESMAGPTIVSSSAADKGSATFEIITQPTIMQNDYIAFNVYSHIYVCCMYAVNTFDDCLVSDVTNLDLTLML